MAGKTGKSKKAPVSTPVLDITHTSPLTFMSVDSFKRARFSVVKPEGKDIDLQITRLVAQLPGLDMDIMSREGVKFSAELTLSIKAEYEKEGGADK